MFEKIGGFQHGCTVGITSTKKNENLDLACLFLCRVTFASLKPEYRELGPNPERHAKMSAGIVTLTLSPPGGGHPCAPPSGGVSALLSNWISSGGKRQFVSKWDVRASITGRKRRGRARKKSAKAIIKDCDSLALNPEKNRCSACVRLTLGHRLRRWPNVDPTQARRLCYTWHTSSLRPYRLTTVQTRAADAHSHTTARLGARDISGFLDHSFHSWPTSELRWPAAPCWHL